MRKPYLWLVFLIGCLLLASGIGLVIEQNQRQERLTRGWELATQQEDMPLRSSSIAGVNVELTQYTDEALLQQLDAIAALGFTWVRQPLYWEQVEPEPGRFEWSTYDRIVDAVAAQPQLELVIVLDGTPDWARHRLAPLHPFAPPASPEQFGDFARRVAQRYGDEVDFYQIWDEPNLRSHWGNTDPQPALYVAMLETSYRAVHGADEEASVIAAALAPTVEQGPDNYNEIKYLQAIYEHGGGDFFDALAAKPYGYDTGPYDRAIGDGTFNFSRIILMREEMIAQGDADKPLWGSNFGWNALPDNWEGPPSIWGQVSAGDQVRFTQEAFQRAAEEWPWMPGLILQHWQPDVPPDDPLQGFAVAPGVARWSDVTLPTRLNVLMPGRHPVQNPFTEYRGAWQFGPLGADAMPEDPEDPLTNTLENSVTVRFYGSELALWVRRYDVITGYYAISIDGDRANELPTNRQGESYIVLKSPQGGESLDLIPVATGLDEGPHIAVISHYPRQGDDAWGLAGIAVAIAPETRSYERLRVIGYGLAGLGILLLAFTVFRLPWQTLRLPSRQTWINLGDTALSLILSAVFVLGTALTWGDTFTSFVRRDPPALLLTLTTVGIAYFSPMVVITLLALVGFALVVFNRPLMGILAVIFWSMFFTSTIDGYVRLIVVVEAMIVISAVAILGRGLFEWTRQLRTRPLEARGQMRASLTDRLHRRLLQLSPFDWGILALVMLALLSLTWAERLPEAIHELRLIFLGPALFYVLLRNLPVQREELPLMIDVVILGGAVIAVIGLYNFVSGEVIDTEEGTRRLIAVYGSPNGVALQLGRCSAFALAYALILGGHWRQWFGGGALLLMGIAVLMTQSVGGIVLGLPASIAVVLLVWQGRRVWGLLAAAAVAGVAALVPLSRLIPRLRNLTDFDSNTTLLRLNLWRSTVEMIEDRPLTGVGLDQFLYAYRSRYILPEGSADPDLSHAHNIVLDYWVRLGLFGVVIAIWLQVWFWKTALKTARSLRSGDRMLFALALGSMGMMAYALAHGIVDTAFFFINLSYLYMLVIALIQYLERFAQDDTMSGNSEEY
ncbi:MAG: hypothetical protein GYB66_10590 [Chloroflexi bacterium]|nr:hypothetical protein [Chloroflexota bacterium]